jgi:hypothetical protein
MFRRPSSKLLCRGRKPVLLLKKEGALESVFQGIRNLSVRCVITSCKLGPGCRFPGRGRKLAAICPRIRSPFVFATRPFGPSPSYRTRRKERALPIVHDEFRRLFLEGLLASIALLRFTGHDQHKPIAVSDGTIYHRTVSSVLTERLSSGAHPSGTTSMVHTSWFALSPDNLNL